MSSVEELMLVHPSMEYLEEISAYRNAFLLSNESMDGTCYLHRFESALEWISFTEQLAHKETLLSPTFVCSTQFLCVRKADRRVVGMIQVRHTLNEFLKNYAGHIGYSVHPDERGKGFAAWMLKSVLPYCRKIGLQRVMAACREENEASRKTILRCGGKYDKTVLEPIDGIWIQQFWIDTATE